MQTEVVEAEAWEPPSSIAALLDRAAQRWPDRPALVSADGDWTFAELVGRVRAAAAALAERDVRAGDRVACLVRHELDDVVTMAALMYLGACFVPVDTSVPDERLAFILQDATCQHLVARPEDSAGRAGLPEHVHDARALAAAVPAPGTSYDVSREPGRSAYVIFTSGSTGRPKGVPVSSGALARHSASVAEAYGLDAFDRTLQFASLGFDVAQEEIWASWVVGGAVVLNPAGVEGFDQLVSFAQDKGVTVLQLPTAFWRTLVKEPSVGAERLAAVRLVIIGSEAAWRDDLERWVDSPLAHARLVNAYGPTEGVVTATAFTFAPGDPLPPGPGVPIGRALPGRAVQVWGEAGLSLDPGTEGTLLISGILADGYLGRPDLQEKRFPATVLGEPGPFYDTGDRVRVLDSGDLEYVGRSDSQVKVRGYRIELEEIDAALGRLPAVKVAGSTLIERVHGEPFLGALVVPSEVVAENEEARVVDAVSRDLRDLLPPYMVPPRIALAPDLPTNVNGKLDRARIAEELVRWTPRSDEWRGDTTALDETTSDESLAGPASVLIPLWRDVLGQPDVGPDDDFFDRGGDSLLAMQFSARARANGWTVLPRDVFRLRTLRRVADAAVPTGAGGGAGDRAPLALLPAQQRWLLDGDLPDMGYFALAALFQVPASFGPEHTAEVAAALLEQHDALRTRLRMLDGDPVVLDGATPVKRVVEHLRVERIDDAVVRTVSVERQSQLSPGAGRVFRLVFIEDDEGERRLLMVAHHLVLDGWSMALLVDDLEHLVRQVLRGDAAELPSPTASPGDLATAYAGLLRVDALATCAERWSAFPWTALAPLPQDRDGEGRLPSLTFAESALPVDVTRTLLEGSSVRLVDLVSAAILTALASWTGRPVQGVDVYAHNRDSELIELDLSRTIGYVQATTPVVREVRGEGAPDLLALAADIREQTPPAFSFDLLRFAGDAHPDAADVAALPLPSARLNYRGHLDRLERRDPDSPLQPAPESTGPNRAPTQHERYQLMFEGDIIDGELVVALKYSTDHYDEATAQRLTDAVAELLCRVADERS